VVPRGAGQDGGLRHLSVAKHMTEAPCLGGYCEMCPVKIQMKCEAKRMTPSDRIAHIRQCLRNMKPVMGYEIAYAAAIGEELDELQRIFARLDEYTDQLNAAENGVPCA